MGSAHDDAANTAAMRFVARGGGPTLGLFAEDSREYEPGYRASFFDTRWVGASLGQVFCFYRIHEAIQEGAAGMVMVDVGQTPLGDQSRAENAAALLGIPHPFRADLDMDQSVDEMDGHLAWAEPIRVTAGFGGESRSVVVPPSGHGLVPLEVGSCAASRVLLHLRQYGAVARWAYGQPWLYLLVGLPSAEEYAVRGAASLAAQLPSLADDPDPLHPDTPETTSD